MKCLPCKAVGGLHERMHVAYLAQCQGHSGSCAPIYIDNSAEEDDGEDSDNDGDDDDDGWQFPF